MRWRRLLRLGRAGAGGLALSLLLAACSAGTAPRVSTSPSSAIPVVPVTHDVVAKFAETPGAPPNWIFPFASLAYYTASNLQQFQYLMYRPLYWFESSTTTTPVFQPSLSLADAPSWNRERTIVTIHLKGWAFWDGQQIDAQAVVFWLNMLEAEKGEWAGYEAGYFPDNVAGYSTAGPTSLSVTLYLRGPVNATWFLYNELSQVVPMPEAWDVTSLSGSQGSGGCGRVGAGLMTGASTDAACRSVWRFDTDSNGQAHHPSMAGDRATYATNVLWLEGVDGPWHLTSFVAKTGWAEFRPNPRYGGPDKPKLAGLIELPFVSLAAELRALSKGGASAPDVGYGSLVGPRVGFAGYDHVPAFPWQISYLVVNFNSTFSRHLLRRLYIRQVLQLLVDQPAIVAQVDHGYGVSSDGPVPLEPRSSFLSPALLENPYPYDPKQALSLLREHGWRVVPGGTDTCVHPGTRSGECGSGIAKGTPLVFNSPVAEYGDPTAWSTFRAEQRTWQAAGVRVNLPYGLPFFALAPCRASASRCGWTLGQTGWLFQPDYMPTGEDQFITAAIGNNGGNFGSYSDPQADALVSSSVTDQGTKELFRWEQYIARQLPVIWQPTTATVVEISRRLAGATAANTSFDFMPELWYAPGG